MKVISVNVSLAEGRLIGGRRVVTAIGKRPVAGPVDVGPLGLVGDEQADPTVHGGRAKAVYAYPAQHYVFWATVRAQACVAPWGDTLPFGSVGENLTLDGVDEGQLWVGDRLVLPGCVLAVTQPRQPCFKFDAAMGFSQASRLMVQSGYCGCYLAVLEPGSLRAGDPLRLEAGPREISLRELFRARRR